MNYRILVAVVSVWLCGCDLSSDVTYEKLSPKNDTTQTSFRLKGNIIYTVNHSVGKYDPVSSFEIMQLDLSNLSKKMLLSYGSHVVEDLAGSLKDSTLVYTRWGQYTNKGYIVIVHTGTDGITESIAVSNDSIGSFLSIGWTTDNKISYLFRNAWGENWRMSINGAVTHFDRPVYPGRRVFLNDGRTMIYSAHDDTYLVSLYAFDMVTKTSKCLVKADSTFFVLRIGYPSLSPDGQQIVFSKEFNGEYPSEIWVVNIDGSNAHRISYLQDGVESGRPVWSPDGTPIAFFNGRYIYVMNTDGSNKLKLNNTQVDDFVWLQ